jgi:hypothetical protein
MSYPLYTPLHPPTGIEHCCKAYFFNEDEVNLVVAKTSFLLIYKLRTNEKGKD